MPQPVAESTFFDPPAGVAVQHNDSGYSNSFKVIRSGQTILTASDPPPLSTAGQSVFALYTDTRGERQLNKYFEPKDARDGTLWSHLEIVKRSRVKVDRTISIRDDITNPLTYNDYTRIALRRQPTIDHTVTLQKLTKLFFIGAERATEKIGLWIVSAFFFGHVTVEGRTTILECMSETDADAGNFKATFCEIRSTDFVTKLHGQAEDTWNLTEETFSEESPTSTFANWLAEELGVFIYEKRCDVIKQLRILIPEILATHAIAGLFLRCDLRLATSKELADEANAILEKLGLISASNIRQQPGDQLVLLWTSPAVIAATKALLKLLGHRQLARCLQRDIGTTKLPSTVLCLASSLIEGHLWAIREIRNCQGFPSLEKQVLGALTKDDTMLYSQHRSRITSPQVASDPQTWGKIVDTLTAIDQAVDLNWNFTRLGVPMSG